MEMTCFRIAVVAVLAVLPVCAGADVYRCVGTDGKILYSDSPCPQGATQQSNITSTVGACSTAECEAKRQQEANDAQERLRAQKDELADLDRRRRSELEAERERAAQEELRLRGSVNVMPVSAAEEDAETYPLYYPGPPYGLGNRPCRPRCGDLRPRPPHASQLPRQEPATRLRR